jgi:hypothetical protein
MLRLLRSLVPLALVWLHLPAPALAQTDDSCKPARAMLVFDRSTSMIRGTIDGKTRWSVATAALREVVSAYQSKVELGLTIFPKDAGTCKTGGVAIVDPPRLDAYASISARLGETAYSPGTNHWTPIGQTLKQLATLPSMQDTSMRRFVILVTDGAQSCPVGLNGNPNEADQIWDVATQVLQVKNLKEQGITTFVIGFGKTSMNASGDDGVDAYALNQLALAGGTASAGCDPNSENAAAPVNCYYQADGADELVGALEEIALAIQDRECGLGEGACQKGTQSCVGGVWGACVGAVGPQAETCDGQDNDCDGVTDPGCDCVAGTTRSCGGAARGECRSGVQTCQADGKWGTECVGAVGPKAEACDGRDNDCDGLVDNPNSGLAAQSLCPALQVCQQGACRPAVEGELAGGGPAGCAVGAGGSPLGAAGLALLVGLVAALRRRPRAR